MQKPIDVYASPSDPVFDIMKCRVNNLRNTNDVYIFYGHLFPWRLVDRMRFAELEYEKNTIKDSNILSISRKIFDKIDYLAAISSDSVYSYISSFEKEIKTDLNKDPEVIEDEKKLLFSIFLRILSRFNNKQRYTISLSTHSLYQKLSPELRLLYEKAYLQVTKEYIYDKDVLIVIQLMFDGDETMFMERLHMIPDDDVYDPSKNLWDNTIQRFIKIKHYLEECDLWKNRVSEYYWNTTDYLTYKNKISQNDFASAVQISNLNKFVEATRSIMDVCLNRMVMEEIDWELLYMMMRATKKNSIWTFICVGNGIIYMYKYRPYIYHENVETKIKLHQDCRKQDMVIIKSNGNCVIYRKPNVDKQWMRLENASTQNFVSIEKLLSKYIIDVLEGNTLKLGGASKIAASCIIVRDHAFKYKIKIPSKATSTLETKTEDIINECVVDTNGNDQTFPYKLYVICKSSENIVIRMPIVEYMSLHDISISQLFICTEVEIQNDPSYMATYDNIKINK